jgi:hypothetical protein
MLTEQTMDFGKKTVDFDTRCLKAESDRVELKRDLSTYEVNFGRTKNRKLTRDLEDIFD